MGAKVTKPGASPITGAGPPPATLATMSQGDSYELPPAEPSAYVEQDYETQVEYENRRSVQRESPYEVFVTLAASMGIVLGLAAILYTPLKLGPIGIALSFLALAFASGRDTIAKRAVVISTCGWLLGMMLFLFKLGSAKPW